MKWSLPAAGDSDANPSIKGNTILCDTLVSGRRQLVSMKDNGTEITMAWGANNDICFISNIQDATEI
jgi:hypothetical protein